MHNNKYISSLVVSFLVCTLFGAGVLANTVLCTDTPGDIALKRVHFVSRSFGTLLSGNTTDCRTTDCHATDCHAIVKKNSNVSKCQFCFDMPVSTNFSNQNITSIRNDPQKIKSLVFNTSNLLQPLCRQAWDNRFYCQSACISTSTLTSLKSTVLLI